MKLSITLVTTLMTTVMTTRCCWLLRREHLGMPSAPVAFSMPMEGETLLLLAFGWNIMYTGCYRSKAVATNVGCT